MKIRIYRKYLDLPLPARQTPRSAGLDVHTAADLALLPGQVVMAPTGLIIESPPGYFFTVHIRSGLSVRHGICLANDVGIIDEDYCGPQDEVRIALVRLFNPADRQRDEPLLIERGTRIGQIIFHAQVFPEVEWEEAASPDFAGKSRGGFGSTGSR